MAKPDLTTWPIMAPDVIGAFERTHAERPGAFGPAPARRTWGAVLWSELADGAVAFLPLITRTRIQIWASDQFTDPGAQLAHVVHIDQQAYGAEQRDKRIREIFGA